MDDIRSYIDDMALLNEKVLNGQKPEPAFGPRADEQDKRLRSSTSQEKATE